HFLLAIRRQGPERVVARRPRLALLCDGMTDDHELHIEERDPRPALPATVVLVPGARLRYFVRTMHLSALLMALVLQASPSQVPDSAHVLIVATTDVHGRVLGTDYVRDAGAPGGLSRAATALETLRARYPGIVVLVDA